MEKWYKYGYKGPLNPLLSRQMVDLYSPYDLYLFGQYGFSQDCNVALDTIESYSTGNCITFANWTGDHSYNLLSDYRNITFQVEIPKFASVFDAVYERGLIKYESVNTTISVTHNDSYLITFRAELIQCSVSFLTIGFQEGIEVLGQYDVVLEPLYCPMSFFVSFEVPFSEEEINQTVNSNTTIYRDFAVYIKDSAQVKKLLFFFNIIM